jgi:hypothetical protein
MILELEICWSDANYPCLLGFCNWTIVVEDYNSCWLGMCWRSDSHDWQDQAPWIWSTLHVHCEISFKCFTDLQFIYIFGIFISRFNPVPLNWCTASQGKSDVFFLGQSLAFSRHEKYDSNIYKGLLWTKKTLILQISKKESSNTRFLQ